MSNIDRSVTNGDVIPIIESQVFDEHPEARFAVGMLAVGNEIIPGRENEFHGYLRLRANVYADQTRMISPDLVRADGTEVDEDDSRAAHFAIVENHDRGTRIVGAFRLIQKLEEDPRPLPIEEFFADVFADKPAPLGATEASRYICRHEIARVQRGLTDPLFSAGVAYVLGRNLGPTFGVVEPVVETDLNAKGIPIRRIADPKYVPEYADDNLGIEIDVPKLGRILELKNPGTLAHMNEIEGDLAYFGRVKARVPQTVGGAVA